MLKQGSAWIVGNADARDAIRRLQDLGQRGRYESAVFDCIDAAGFDPVVEMNKTPEGLEDDAPSGKVIGWNVVVTPVIRPYDRCQRRCAPAPS